MSLIVHSENLELTEELDLHILKILIKQQPKRGGEIKRDMRGVCVCMTERWDRRYKPANWECK